MAFSCLVIYPKLAQLPKGGIARNNQHRSCTFLFGISSVLKELIFECTHDKKNLLFRVKAIRGYNPMLFPKPCRSAKQRAMHGNQVAGGLHIALAGIFKHTTCCWKKMQIVGHCMTRLYGASSAQLILGPHQLRNSHLIHLEHELFSRSIRIGSLELRR